MCTLCLDLVGSVHDKNSLSCDQAQFVDLVSDSIWHCDNSHYKIALPLQNRQLQLLYNCSAAKRKIQFLKQKFIKNAEFYNDYKICIQPMITSGYIENVESTKGQEGKTWFIPHHGMYHKDKPGKVRVTFDCSAKFKGICLNNCLYHGPYLTFCWMSFCGFDGRVLLFKLMWKACSIKYKFPLKLRFNVFSLVERWKY